MTTAIIAPARTAVRLRAIGGAELAHWDAYVRRFANHRVMHTRAWLEALGAVGAGDPLWLLFERDGQVVGCLPGLIVRVAGFRLFGSPLPGWQTSSLGPAFDPEALDTETMLSLLVPYLRDVHGVRHVEFLHAGLDPEVMRRHGFREEAVPTYRAPLDPVAPDATFAALKESARRNIRRAERLGLEVRFGVDPAFVRDHYDQVREAYLRGGQAVPFSLRRLEEGVARLDAAGRLVAVSVLLPGSDVRIATGTFLVEGRELLLWMWGHRTHYRWYRPTELMTWRVMEHAMHLGCDTFDLMGRGEFKRKFGATLDESKRRWIRSDQPLLRAGREVARRWFHIRATVAGRAARGGERAAALVRHPGAWRRHHPEAVVLGDIDLVRALGLRGITTSVFAPRADAARFSRHVAHILPWHDPWDHPEQVVDVLLRHAAAQGEPPPLFYQDDASLLLVSRHRDRLAQAYRFVLPDARLVERLVDKAQFQRLAEELALPVPRARALDPRTEGPPDTLPFDGPMVLKPLTRRPARWAPLGGEQKALLVPSLDALRELWPHLVAAGLPVLAQELVPGPESGIESYHVYVDRSGTVLAEFTGRKIRTYPAAFGDSSALEITDAPDVLRLGQTLVRKLRLQGVAKFDFKRRPDGTLALLEVNPRFTLWHHPAARAGVNIPAMVYDDLLDPPRARIAPVARAGVRWCKLWTDHAAARASGVPFLRWALWALRCEAKRAIAWSDPLPLVGAGMRAWIARLLLVAGLGCSGDVSGVPPGGYAPVALIGAGDIATCFAQYDSATAVLVREDTGLVFAAGDVLHDTASTATYEGCFGETWGTVGDRILPAMGNHDYDHASGAAYFSYFGARAGTPGAGFYSRDHGAWHLIVLNSNSTVVPTEPGSPQERWLRADLAANERRCTLAIFHHPRFYQGTFNRNGAVRPFWAALLEARADVVVNGHFHLYERYAPQDADGGVDLARGIRQFTVGTGGRTLDALVQPAPNLEYRQADRYGILRLTLGDGWYAWAFVATDRTVLDTGQAPCVE